MQPADEALHSIAAGEGNCTEYGQCTVMNESGGKRAIKNRNQVPAFEFVDIFLSGAGRGEIARYLPRNRWMRSVRIFSMVSGRGQQGCSMDRDSLMVSE